MKCLVYQEVLKNAADAMTVGRPTSPEIKAALEVECMHPEACLRNASEKLSLQGRVGCPVDETTHKYLTKMQECAMKIRRQVLDAIEAKSEQ